MKMLIVELDQRAEFVVAQERTLKVNLNVYRYGDIVGPDQKLKMVLFFREDRL